MPVKTLLQWCCCYQLETVVRVMPQQAPWMAFTNIDEKLSRGPAHTTLRPRAAGRLLEQAPW